MSKKIITAWVNGQVQEIEVEVTTSEEQVTVEDRLNEIDNDQVVIDSRLDELEDKPIIADGNMLVGNGTTELLEITPEDVLSHINGVSVLPLTTAEYEAIGENSNANTLYVITDEYDNYYTDVEVDEKLEEHTSQVFTDIEIDEVCGSLSAAPIQVVFAYKTVSVPYAPNITLATNTLTQIGELSGNCTITLGNSVDGYDNEWSFIINQGDTTYDIVLPEISWQLGIAPTFNANTTTHVRLYYIGETLKGVWDVE